MGVFMGILTFVLPEPDGPTSISPCLTTVVSYSWIIFVMYPGKKEKKTHRCGWSKPASDWGFILNPKHPALTVHIFETHLIAHFADRLLQGSVVDGLLTNFGEEVRHDAIEELKVVLQELGHIYVSDGAQTNQFLQKRNTFRTWIIPSSVDVFFLFVSLIQTIQNNVRVRV